MAQDDPTADNGEAASDEPTLADRIDASDDFRASLEQSTALLAQYRRIFLLVLLGSLLLATLTLASRYGLIG